MKFKGKPNSVIIDGYTGKQIGQFDADGIWETTDPKWITRLKAAGVEVYNAEEKPQENEAAEKKIVCKKCGQEFENQGLFLAHCRGAHPKGEKK